MHAGQLRPPAFAGPLVSVMVCMAMSLPAAAWFETVSCVMDSYTWHVHIRPISQLIKVQHTSPPPALHLGWEGPLLSHHLPLQLQWGRLPTGSSLTGRGWVLLWYDVGKKYSVHWGYKLIHLSGPPHSPTIGILYIQLTMNSYSLSKQKDQVVYIIIRTSLNYIIYLFRLVLHIVTCTVFIIM